MKMKKILAVLSTAALCTAMFAACGDTSSSGGSAASGGAAGGSDGPIKVGIINNDPNESGYRTANDKDLQEAFSSANGFDAKFAYSMKNDEQIAAAQKFIQDEVDYLLISAADTAGWDSVLKDAQAAGVSVILFDRTIDASEDLYEASIVSDMAKEGTTAVEWLKGQNLDSYKVIHIQGVMGSAAQKGRSQALTDAAAADSGKWESRQVSGTLKRHSR